MSYRENILVDLDTLDLTANSGVNFDKYSETIKIVMAQDLRGWHAWNLF